MLVMIDLDNTLADRERSAAAWTKVEEFANALVPALATTPRPS
mgnify:CR=1 FL=1